MAESALDRKLGRYTLEQVAHAVLLAIALFLRLFLLEQKPQHHDESIHAFFSWKITEDGIAHYQYDPVYHGPVLYYSTAAILALLGDNDFTVRLSAVLFGMGVLLFAWPLRRYLGRAGALAFLALLTFSPAFTYFTRFLRHDIYLALCNLGAVYFAFRYGETRVPKFLYASAVSLSLAFCTKEDMYLLTPLFLVSFAGMLLWEVLGAERRREAWRAAWQETREFFRASWLPILTSGVLFSLVWLVFYTSFFTHPENWNGVRRALVYWWGQHKIQRIGGPWWYYVPQLSLYEPLLAFPFVAVLVPPLLGSGIPSRLGKWLRGLAGAALLAFVVLLVGGWPFAPQALLLALLLGTAALATVRVPDRFFRFAFLWSLGALAIYAWAQEKVPWLLVPMLLPLSLVAGRWFGDAWERGALRRLGTLAILLPVGAGTLWSLVAVNYLYDAPDPKEPKDRRHSEMLVYVQSTYDILRTMEKIEEIGEKLGTGTQTRLQVSGNATWPFSWYLRHYPVNWAANPRVVDTPVVIVDREVKALDEPLREEYDRRIIEIRGWWEPDWKNLTLPKLLRWYFTRVAWNMTGSSDALVFTHKNPRPGMTFRRIEVNPPPAPRDYPTVPAVRRSEFTFGEPGSGPGQFQEPRDIAVARDGTLYVVDTKNHRIQHLRADGTFLHAWGRQGNGPGEFQDPHGIALGPDGSVYVADTWNHRIQKFDATGRFLLEFAPQSGFWGPRDLVVAEDGTVYVSDTGNKRIVVFTSEGQELRTWGKEGSGPGEFIEPVGIAIDTKGRIVVADTGNRRLQFFDPQGRFLEQWQVFGWEEFYTEPYIAIDGDQIYVTDSFNHRFARYSGSGKLTGTWGKPGTERGAFNRPIGIAVGPNGEVYVSDTMNHRIQRFFLPGPEGGG